MASIRKEVVDLTRCCDVLLNSEAMQTPLNDQERELLTGYLVRVCGKLDVWLTDSPEPLKAQSRLSQKAS